MENISIIGDKCVGCRSCEQVCPKHCIDMQFSKEGFLYPIINENECVYCGRCLKVCPTQKTQFHRNDPRNVWAFRNKNDQEVMLSASGGAATVASSAILKQGGVVFGAAYDEKLSVKHIKVSSETDKYKLQSSKYVQSDMGDCYTEIKELLDSGKTVLFTGTPCQVAGVYSFLGGDRKGLYTIDLICHGVPSPKLFEKYLKFQGDRIKEQVISFNFRSKEKRGWGTQYLLKTQTQTKTKPLALDPYGKHFLIGDCYRECCYQCEYANLKRVGDITIGDFWGISKCHPEFYSSKGVSSVFVNTCKGESLFDKMKGQANVLPSTLKDGIIKQGNLVKPTSRPASRDIFYSRICENDFIDKLSVGIQLKERIKALVPQEWVQRLKRF